MRTLFTSLGVTLVLAHAGVMVAALRMPSDSVTMPADGPFNPGSSPAPPNVVVTVDGTPTNDVIAATRPTGMHRIEWTSTFRGGFIRRVGRTVLSGPFHESAGSACGIELWLRSELLANESVLGVVRQEINEGLANFDRWPLGRFRTVRALVIEPLRLRDLGPLSLRFADLMFAPDTVILRASMRLGFDDGEVPVEVAILPVFADGALAMRTEVSARVRPSGRIGKWVADLAGANGIARRQGERVMEELAAATVSRPPPVDLGDGRRLPISFCTDQPLTLSADDTFMRLALAVPVRPRNGGVGAIDVEQTTATPDPGDSDIAVFVDGRAGNALLHTLWRDGDLDRWLDQADLEGAFNDAPLVKRLLSLRIGAPVFRLPPVVAAAGGRAVLSSEIAVPIRDGSLSSEGRVFGRMSWHEDRVAMSELNLSCRTERRLTPCYPLIAQQLRERAPEAQELLSKRFLGLVERLIHGRKIALSGGLHLILRGPALVDQSVDGQVRLRLASQVKVTRSP